MYTPAEKSKENSFPKKREETRAVANSLSQKKSNEKQDIEFADNRTKAIAQRKFQLMINNGPVLKSNTNNVTQRYYACVASDWRQKDLYLPTGTSVERKNYAKDKLKTAYPDGVKTVNEVTMVSARVNDTDFIYVSEGEQYANPNTATIDKTIELSDILTTYDATKACVIQALVRFKGTVLTKNTASDLHDHIFATPVLSKYKEYDLDNVYPVLYTDVGLTKIKTYDNQKIKDIMGELTVGNKYIFESSGDPGHNFVITLPDSEDNISTSTNQDTHNTKAINKHTTIKAVWK
jgi:hypothetical protein